MRALCDWFRKVETPPYVVEFQVPTQFDSATVDLGQFKGLLYLQVLVKGLDLRLLTFWTSQQAYLPVQALFPTRIGLASGTAPSWEGFHREARGRKVVSWWTIVTAGWAAIATFFVILGYSEKLRDAFAWIIAPPQLVAFGPPLPVEVVVGEAFDIDFKVRNVSSLGISSIHFDSEQFLDSGNTVAPAHGLELLHLADARFAAMKPNDEKSFKLFGKALQAGTYEVIVKGDSHSGIWSKPISVSGVVRVWKPLDFGERRLGDNQLRECAVVVKFFVGRPQAKVDIQANLAGEAGVTFENQLQFPNSSTGRVGHIDTPGKENTFLRWQAENLLDAKKSYEVILRLKSQTDRTSQEWEGIVKKIEFRF